jgi:hypothetical protein
MNHKKEQKGQVLPALFQTEAFSIRNCIMSAASNSRGSTSMGGSAYIGLRKDPRFEKLLAELTPHD